MNSKTKIIVLHMKEIIYTVIFATLGILILCLLFFMFSGIPLYPTKNILPAFIPLLLHSEMKIWNWKFLSLTPLSIPSAFPI